MFEHQKNHIERITNHLKRGWRDYIIAEACQLGGMHCTACIPSRQVVEWAAVELCLRHPFLANLCTHHPYSSITITITPKFPGLGQAVRRLQFFQRRLWETHAKSAPRAASQVGFLDASHPTMLVPMDANSALCAIVGMTMLESPYWCIIEAQNYLKLFFIFFSFIIWAPTPCIQGLDHQLPTSMVHSLHCTASSSMEHDGRYFKIFLRYSYDISQIIESSLLSINKHLSNIYMFSSP